MISAAFFIALPNRSMFSFVYFGRLAAKRFWNFLRANRPRRFSVLVGGTLFLREMVQT